MALWGMAKRADNRRDTHASIEDLRLVAEFAPVAMWVTGPDRARRFVNRAYAEFLGMSQEEALHQDWRTFVHPEDAALVQAAEQSGMTSGRPIAVLGRFRRHDGAWRWMEIISQPRRDPADRHIGFVGVAHDVTEAKETEIALRHREAQFSAFISQSAAGFGQVDLDGRFTLVNDRFCEMIGWSREEIIGRSLKDITHPDDVAWSWENFERAVTEGTPYTQDKRYVRKDGSVAWVHNSVAVIRRPDSSLIGVLAVSLDVGEAKRAAARQQLLIDELNHRVKNTLAIVQGIAQQSLKAGSDPEAAHAAFEGRIQALAGAHNLLTRERWGPVPMWQIIDDAVAPHGEAADRFQLSGPKLMITPKTAISLALAIHELATNAVKHGALSRPEGRVTIDWVVAEDAATGSRLRLRWAESGGPQVSHPVARGFGTRMIERGLAAELQGDVRIQFEPDGVVCTVEAPLPEARA